MSDYEWTVTITIGVTGPNASVARESAVDTLMQDPKGVFRAAKVVRGRSVEPKFVQMRQKAISRREDIDKFLLFHRPR